MRQIKLQIISRDTWDSRWEAGSLSQQNMTAETLNVKNTNIEAQHPLKYK